MDNTLIIENVFNRTTRSAQVREAVLFVENTSGDFSVNLGYGGIEVNSPLLMASVTKLLTTTCVLILQEQGQLSLNEPVIKYLDKNLLKGLHTLKGVDYTDTLTISDLLFQVSGFSDWYEAVGVRACLTSFNLSKKGI
jgi:CubicO group peptidase (beta-lactamase class C family)